MPLSTAHKLLRRTALTLIICLQSAHFVLQMHNRRPQPQRFSRVLITIAKVIELCFFSFCTFKLVERNWDVRMGRRLIRGSGVDALLWAMVAWSAAMVIADGWGVIGELVGSVQLIGMDVVMSMEILGRGLAWVERREGEGDVEELRDEKAGGEGMEEKQEV